MTDNRYLIGYDEPILITGAGGFIGPRVVRSLVASGFRNLRCLVRGTSNLTALNSIIADSSEAKIQLIEGNLLTREDCTKATDGVSMVLHLAAGTEKTFPGCYMNSVVATRNLLDSVLENVNLKRFVNVSSIAVYSNRDTNKTGILDEESEMETDAMLRHEAYVYGKVKQDELVLDYAKRFRIPFVIVRPGEVFGPGKRKISGKVGIDTFGIFLHLGGPNQVPLTYVDNCAEAIAMAGVVKGVDGETFNIVDDDLPSSRKFLGLYKKNVKRFRSLYVPYGLTYFLCYLWERYSERSNGQLPPVFNRRQCIADWKKVKYSNKKIKYKLGWKPSVTMEDALRRYFEFMKGSAKGQ
jgi:nucleoside-diphosphate-sugar epimerase